MHLGHGARALLRTFQTLRQSAFSSTIILPPSMRPHYPIAAWLSSGSRRIAAYHAGQPWSQLAFLNHQCIRTPPGSHDAERMVALINVALEIEAETPADYVIREIPNHPGLIGVHPGCKRQDDFKRWPLDAFFALLELLTVRHSACRFRVFFGPDEAETKQYFASLLASHDRLSAPGRVEVATNLSIESLFDRIGECAAFIANDSGLMHIAAAQNVPTLGIFGPTDAIRTRPFNRKSHAIVNALPCSPCALTDDPRRRAFHCIHPTRRCLTELAPTTVANAFDALYAA
ncbi:MAG TPA: glycosyltransferase family 9 protein [Rhodocyclaceae bacterium]|nr:glycosyltransferase family 9 protein [Rhodocyclaceae bacterium]